MKAILIDPFQRSLETIDIENDVYLSLVQIRKLVGEDGLDFAFFAPGESIAVGDHSALVDPPLPHWLITGYSEALYGRGVLCGYRADGTCCDTRFSVDSFSQLIEFP